MRAGRSQHAILPSFSFGTYCSARKYSRIYYRCRLIQSARIRSNNCQSCRTSFISLRMSREKSKHPGLSSDCQPSETMLVPFTAMVADRGSCGSAEFFDHTGYASGGLFLNPHVYERFRRNSLLLSNDSHRAVEIAIDGNQVRPSLDIGGTFNFHRVLFIISTVVRIPEESCFLNICEVFW